MAITRTLRLGNSEPVALQEIDGVCAAGGRVWRLLLSMKRLCHVERSEAKSRHLRLRQSPSHWERIKRRHSLAANETFDSASAFAEDGYGGRAAPLKMTVGERAAYHGVQCNRVFASALIAMNTRVTHVMVEKSAFPPPPLKNIGFFDANPGDRNSPSSFQPLFTRLSSKAIGSVTPPFRAI